MYQRDLEMNYGNGIIDQAKVLSLLEDTEFMLTYNLVALARNQNYFSQMDTYMKELARIVLSLKEHSHV